MLDDMPKVKLREEEYQLEPLGIADIFALKKMVQSIGGKVAKELDTDSINLMKMDKLSQLQQMKILMTAIDVAEKELYNLLNIITGIDKKTLQNKNKIPADAPLKILTTFWEEHPDIQAYKEQMGKFSKSQPVTRETGE